MNFLGARPPELSYFSDNGKQVPFRPYEESDDGSKISNIEHLLTVNTIRHSRKKSGMSAMDLPQNLGEFRNDPPEHCCWRFLQNLSIVKMQLGGFYFKK